MTRYTCHFGIVTWESFREYLQKNIAPFLDFNTSRTQFEHIQYAGCGSLISVLTWDFINTLRLQYSHLFIQGFTAEEIPSFELNADVARDLLYMNKDDGKFYLRIFNREKLREYLESANFDASKISTIIERYQRQLFDEKQIRDKVSGEPEGVKLLNIWDTTALKSLELTPVGKAIAAIHYEQVTSTKLDLDIWIN